MKVPVMTITTSTTATTTAPSSTNNSTMSSSADPKLRRRPSAMPSTNKTTPAKAPLPPPTTPTYPRVAQRPTVSLSSVSNPSLHPNVTTRSPKSSRKPRADTVSSGISQLHIPSRPPSAADIQRPASATGSRVSVRSERSERSESRQSQYGSESRQSQYGAVSPSPRFFHASDVRSTKPTPKVAPPLRHEPSHGKFFFANSIQTSSRNSSPTPPQLHSPRIPGASPMGILGEPPSLSPSLPILARSESRTGSAAGARSRPSSMVSQGPLLFPETRNHVKFVYANGTEEVLEPRGSEMGRGSEIGRSELGRSELGRGSSEFGRSSENGSILPSPQVPGSPNATHFPFASPTKQLSPATSPNPNTASHSPFQKPSPPSHSRRTSLEGIVARHGRTLSISSIIDMADLLEEEAAKVPETPAEKYARRSSSPPAITSAAPVISAKERIAAMEEAAARARRERKVLDLEISNASLLAINKTLERQLKKQTAELRRYRRLSRSGRIPILPPKKKKRRRRSSAADPEDSEGYHVGGDSDAEKGGEEDEDDEDDEDEDEGEGRGEEEEEDSDTTGEEGADEKESCADEKRLKLDLSKHQELLDNSAKMNASLKGCQSIVDQLIADAKKALDYKIRASDVQLGGRILDYDAETETEIETEAETDDGHEDDQTETEDGEDYDDYGEEEDSEDDDDLEEMEEIHLPDANGMSARLFSEEEVQD